MLQKLEEGENFLFYFKSSVFQPACISFMVGGAATLERLVVVCKRHDVIIYYKSIHLILCIFFIDWLQ